ncbi:DUF2164 domain-containing protein [Geotalea toluenoxydans]|uniref:DUF2164 domain-containing protein n=1 Tax=Geotalea toluenoxydans TaxID=421624 RepID=UPI0006D19E2D|nr:DUF2164 domain-containing protein [Geotalea toluenoxydans]
MAIELSKQDVDDIVNSLRKYCKEELELEISGMQAKFFLDYIMKEIAPFAYNKGIKDAEAYFQAKVEDLPGICFEEGMTYWHKKRK